MNYYFLDQKLNTKPIYEDVEEDGQYEDHNLWLFF